MTDIVRPAPERDAASSFSADLSCFAQYHDRLSVKLERVTANARRNGERSGLRLRDLVRRIEPKKVVRLYAKAERIGAMD